MKKLNVFYQLWLGKLLEQKLIYIFQKRNRRDKICRMHIITKFLFKIRKIGLLFVILIFREASDTKNIPLFQNI